MKYGYFDDKPGVVRYSTIMRRCREQRMSAVAAELERIYRQFDTCEVHGHMADPVVGTVGDQIAICCPHCSGSDVMAAWEAEGTEVLA